jgi:hypothetical protein
MTPDRIVQGLRNGGLDFLFKCQYHPLGEKRPINGRWWDQGALEDAAARLVEVMAGPRNMSSSAIDQKRLSLAERTTTV